MYGTSARILRVNLTSSEIQVQTLSEDFYRLYPGGKALAGYFLLTEMPAHVDPFAPENLLVFACGLLTGAPEVRFTTAPGGHLGVLTGRGARTTTWPAIDEFLADHA